MLMKLHLVTSLNIQRIYEIHEHKGSFDEGRCQRGTQKCELGKAVTDVTLIAPYNSYTFIDFQ